ncbi:MAG: bifunctional lysylphosphatidylglycerol flippase/synthetase MprF [Gemmatimonadaceae bacterium]
MTQRIDEPTPVEPVTPTPVEPLPAAPGRRGRVARWIGPLAVLAVVALALEVLRDALRHYRYRDLASALHEIPNDQIVLATLLTALAYAILPAYDALALMYAGRRVPLRRVAFGSFIAYGLSQTLGFAALTGNAVRYRFWSSWGLSTSEIARAAAFAGTTFVFGVVAIAGVVLVVEPVSTVELLHVPLLGARVVGVICIAVVASYLAWSALRHEPVRFRSFEIPVPRFTTAVRQLLIAIADWSVAGAVLYVLLPAGARPALLPFLGVFLLAQFVGLVSHVPGGLGVFEALMVTLLAPTLGAREVVGALLAYRLIYYLLPFVLAVLSLTARESRIHVPLRVAGRAAGRWMPAIVPHALSIFTFVAGAILLFSGATPSVRSRLALLHDALPLALIEASHLTASLTGAALLVVAWGIRRRLDAAYHITIGLLALGMLTSLLKGLDWEEALALGLVLAVLAPARPAFYRRTRLLNEPFTPQWIVAVTTVVAASIWLGAISFRHAGVTNSLWLRFAPHADAARFLRASAGVVLALAAYAALRLLRIAPPEIDAPDDDALARAATIIAASPDTTANLALLGDKRLLFSDSGRAFIMYGVVGRSWIALGDPIGPPGERAELAWKFREEADRHDAWTVFYLVSTESLPLCIDLGLSLVKVGERAIVPLTDFSLQGSSRKRLRQAMRDVESAGATFSVTPPAEVPALLPEMRRVSDDWLAAKNTREKGFSLGYFNERYLRAYPIACVHVAGRLVAFANLWQANDHGEISVDLMRYSSDAPASVMDFLFVSMMLWGRQQGYATFDLGMASLSGIEGRELAPLWNRAGSWLYRHGEHFYNFQGLRRYKSKFDPQWDPRYLASPGGLALPRALAGVSILISRGLRGVVAH